MIIKAISTKLAPELCNIFINRIVKTKMINIPITFKSVLFFEFLSPFTIYITDYKKYEKPSIQTEALIEGLSMFLCIFT